MGLPGACRLALRVGRAAEVARADAPRLPHLGTAGASLRVAESPHRTSAASARPPVRSLAARTRGARPRTLTRAAHSRVPGPTPVPGSCGLSHPARAPPQVPVPPSPRQPSSPGLRDQPHSRPRCHRGCAASHRRGRRGPGLPGAAHTPRARPGHEARRKGRRRAWGWHSGSLTGAPTLTRVPHPSPPPPLQHKRLQEEWRSPSNVPVVQGSAGSSMAGGRRARSQGRARSGAAAPRCGQRPPAEPAGYPLLSHRARRQLRPAVVPPPPPPPPAFPPPPAGCGGEAGKRRARLLRQARTLGWAGGRLEKALLGWRRESAEPEAVAGTRGGGVMPHRSRTRARGRRPGAAARRPGNVDGSRRAVC